MRVVCDHCGNAVFASWGNTGIVDELTKRVGWRPDSATAPVRQPASRRRSAAADEEAEEVARELRELGLEASGSEVADWLADDASGAGGPALEHPPAGLAGVVDRLERAEASQTPMRREILDRFAPGTKVRDDIAWQRTAEGHLACSGHCFEQLSFCATCNLPRTAPAHRSCSSYVPPCTEHGGAVLRFPRTPG
jgi:hypothetical protein